MINSCLTPLFLLTSSYLAIVAFSINNRIHNFTGLATILSITYITCKKWEVGFSLLFLPSIMHREFF